MNPAAGTGRPICFSGVVDSSGPSRLSSAASPVQILVPSSPSVFSVSAKTSSEITEPVHSGLQNTEPDSAAPIRSGDGEFVFLSSQIQMWVTCVHWTLFCLDSGPASVWRSCFRFLFLSVHVCWLSSQRRPATEDLWTRPDSRPPMVSQNPTSKPRKELNPMQGTSIEARYISFLGGLSAENGCTLDQDQQESDQAALLCMHPGSV